MKILLTLAFALFALIPQTNAMDKKTMNNEASPVKAVLFYASTCGACKILEPHLSEAFKTINQDKIEMVRFDFSSKDTIATTKALAKEKNVNDILQKYGAKTGFVVLLDNQGNELDILKAEDSSADIASKIAKAVVAAS